MGAVSLIFYLQNIYNELSLDFRIKSIILDSPFLNLTKMIL